MASFSDKGSQTKTSYIRPSVPANPKIPQSSFHHSYDDKSALTTCWLTCSALKTYYCLDFWNWEVIGCSPCPLHHQPGLATFLKALHQKHGTWRSLQQYIPLQDLPNPQVPMTLDSQPQKDSSGLNWTKVIACMKRTYPQAIFAMAGEGKDLLKIV